jgi:hypothetical protein
MGWTPYFKTGWATIEGIRIRAIAKERDPDRKLLRVTPVGLGDLGLRPEKTSDRSDVPEIPESDFDVLPEDRSPRGNRTP